MDIRILLLYFLFAPNFILLGQNIDTSESYIANSQQEIWHVKAMHPDGYTMDVKAFDSEGNKYDVNVDMQRHP